VSGGTTDAHEIEQSLGVLRLREDEDLIFVLADRVVAGGDVYHEELAIVLAFDFGADVALVDLASATRYLVFCEHRITHNDLLFYTGESEPSWYADAVRLCTGIGTEEVMRTERVEVRLDSETRSKLEELAAARGSSVSELVRSLIERSHEEEVAGASRPAAERIGGMEVEDVPEPAELKRQLSEAHEASPGETP